LCCVNPPASTVLNPAIQGEDHVLWSSGSAQTDVGIAGVTSKKFAA
jgi:hypothetical protein